jgi:hypothetical protein
MVGQVSSYKEKMQTVPLVAEITSRSWVVKIIVDVHRFLPPHY